MGTVDRKSFTKPLPAGAEIITRKAAKLVRWRDTRGKTQTPPLTDAGDRIRIESETWYATLWDGHGIVVEVPTGCRTEDAPRQVLADLEQQVERVPAGLLTPAEARTAEHLRTPIGEHFDACLDAPAATDSVPMHGRNTRMYLNRLADGCGFRRLARADPLPLARGHPALQRSGRVGADLPPRPEGRRHPQARRPGPHSRRACIENDIWCTALPGRVPLRTAPAAMRHSDPKLTANVYTDPRLLEVHGALDTLPTLPLDAGPGTDRESLRAIGTKVHGSLSPPLPPTRCKPVQIGGIPDTATVESPSSLGPAQPGKIPGFSGESPGFPGVAADNMQGRAISSVGKGTSIATENLSGVTSSHSSASASVSADNTKSAPGSTADPLADFVASLTAEQRRRLASLLASKLEGGDDA